MKRTQPLASAATAFTAPRRSIRMVRSFLFVALASACVAASAAGVTYNGGPVVSNAKVFMINWSSDVAAQVQAQMPVFYADILVSDYWTILSQYSTPAPQQLGFGTFAGSATLTSTGCGAGSGNCTLTDIDVLNEITARVNSDDPSLPSLSLDALGNVDTVLMVHFGPSTKITVQSARSCIDFDAIFEDIQADAAHGNAIVPMGIVADCFNGDEPATASVVLTNIAADPQYIGTSGWLSAIGYGIGDLCLETSANIVANGNAYTVRKVWSNGSNACISANEIFAGGFEH